MNERLSAFISERIAANDFPSAVYLVAEKGEIVYHDALGNAVVTPEVIPAKVDTIYDLASLTKVLVTGLLSAMLVETGKVDLDEIVETYFPDKSEFGYTLVFDLLTHTSGYQAWKPFYLLAEDSTLVLDEILASEPVPGGPDVVYSDLNFLTLMFLVERVANNDLESLARTMIFEPLGLNDSCYRPRTSLRPRIAASELGNEYERQTCIEKGYLPDGDRIVREGGEWSAEMQKPDREEGLNIQVDRYALANARASANLRTQQIWGEVHDGNAYFMGGVAGHAGLFSTAEEVFKIALQFLPQYTRLLKPETCELFRTNFTKGMNEDRSFAFQLASTEGSTAGTSMSPESFGHNGFTGTSLWIDPVKDRIFILLTNRTHNHPLPFVNINSVRRRFHDIAIEELQKPDR